MSSSPFIVAWTEVDRCRNAGLQGMLTRMSHSIDHSLDVNLRQPNPKITLILNIHSVINIVGNAQFDYRSHA